MVKLRLPQSIVLRDRPRSSEAAEELSGRNAIVADDLSSILRWDEDDNDSLPERHDNHDGLDSDIKAERLSESLDPDIKSERLSESLDFFRHVIAD